MEQKQPKPGMFQSVWQFILFVLIALGFLWLPAIVIAYFACDWIWG